MLRPIRFSCRRRRPRRRLPAGDFFYSSFLHFIADFWGTVKGLRKTRCCAAEQSRGSLTLSGSGRDLWLLRRPVKVAPKSLL